MDESYITYLWAYAAASQDKTLPGCASLELAAAVALGVHHAKLAPQKRPLSLAMFMAEMKVMLSAEASPGTKIAPVVGEDRGGMFR